MTLEPIGKAWIEGYTIPVLGSDVVYIPGAEKSGLVRLLVLWQDNHLTLATYSRLVEQGYTIELETDK